MFSLLTSFADRILKVGLTTFFFSNEFLASKSSE